MLSHGRAWLSAFRSQEDSISLTDAWGILLFRRWAVSDGREEREEQEWRREQERRKDREDRQEREPEDQWKPERRES